MSKIRAHILHRPIKIHHVQSAEPGAEASQLAEFEGDLRIASWLAATRTCAL